MTPVCPYCSLKDQPRPDRPKVSAFGSFYRRSDSRTVRRFLCQGCRKTFSLATLHACYRQKKRQKNTPLRNLLVSGVSLRRSARLLNLSRTTVMRKFHFLGDQAALALKAHNDSFEKENAFIFDDMETFEHSKCKPVSIPLAVTSSRRILAFDVARMPAKGPLAAIAMKKYGTRVDERKEARERLFQTVKPLVLEVIEIKSDQNPHYPPDVKKHFPEATHKTYKGRRGCVVGQGELKRGGYDPLFPLNHTAAMFRANMNRLFRRTWCTTKTIKGLRSHLSLYAAYHNLVLLKA